MKRGKEIVRYDVSDIKEGYRVEVVNRFGVLQIVVDEKESEELAVEIRNIIM